MANMLGLVPPPTTSCLSISIACYMSVISPCPHVNYFINLNSVNINSQLSPKFSTELYTYELRN